MFPKSDLQKLKEWNQYFQNIITLLNLHLNTRKKIRRKAYSLNLDDECHSSVTKKRKISFMDDPDKENIHATSKELRRKITFTNHKALTRLDTMIQISEKDEQNEISDCEEHKHREQVQTQSCEPIAFQVKFLYNKKLEKILKRNKRFTPMITVFWENKDEVEYTFERKDMMFLPEIELNKLSRTHGRLVAKRRVKPKQYKYENHFMFESSQNSQFLKILQMSTQPDEGNDERLAEYFASQGREENPKNEEYEFEFTFQDSSLNGTFYSTEEKLYDKVQGGVDISKEFETMKKDEGKELHHGDIVGLIVPKPDYKNLIFGFQILIPSSQI